MAAATEFRPTRVLGSGDAAMTSSMQGFGCMGITAFYGKPIPDEDGIAVIKHAFDNGVTHFDTAEVYTCKAEDGTTIYNETIVGKAIRSINKRNEIQIATKYFPAIHGDTMTPELVLEACRASCERLGVDYIDLYYVHRIHPSVSVEDQALSMLACKKAGLVKYIGVSEFSPQNLKIFHNICPVTCVQQEWSLINRDLEEELVPACRSLGIGIVAYSPLCRSLLSGEVTSLADFDDEDLRSKRYPRFRQENLASNILLVEDVKKMAQDRQVTAAQLSLGWVSNQGEDVVPIPGTTKVSHLQDNLDSRKIVLSEEELENIASLVQLDQVKGDRYPGGETAFTFRDQMTKGSTEKSTE